MAGSVQHGALASHHAPIEIIRVLNAAPRSASAPRSPRARERAGQLAKWLSEGGERSLLAAAAQGTVRDVLPEEPVALDGAARNAGAAARLAAPVAQERFDAAPAHDPAAALVLRIQMGGGEISEQVYGPTRRWALLDEDGRCVETPESELAARLLADGVIALDRFESGAAVYRLSSAAEPLERAAYAACKRG